MNERIPLVMVRYPTGEAETIAARPTDKPDEYELRAHGFLVPLGPGDVVRVDDSMMVQDVVSLDPQLIYHVDLHLPMDFFGDTPLPDDHPAVVAVEKLVDEWQRDTTVTLLTTFSMVISSKTQRWFDEKVAGHNFVQATLLTRTTDVRTMPIEANPALPPL